MSGRSQIFRKGQPRLSWAHFNARRKELDIPDSYLCNAAPNPSEKAAALFGSMGSCKRGSGAEGGFSRDTRAEEKQYDLP